MDRGATCSKWYAFAITSSYRSGATAASAGVCTMGVGQTEPSITWPTVGGRRAEKDRERAQSPREGALSARVPP